MDRAILSHVKDLDLEAMKDNYRKVDEIPFDFTRRRMSVVIEDNSGKRQIVTKVPWRRCSKSAPTPKCSERPVRSRPNCEKRRRPFASG